MDKKSKRQFEIMIYLLMTLIDEGLKNPNSEVGKLMRAGL